MDFLDDPEEMTPEQRLAEIAAILAAGYLRVRRSRPEPVAPFTENPLDCSGDERPCGVDGLTEREPVEVTP